jgi:hypothetical protein
VEAEAEMTEQEEFEFRLRFERESRPKKEAPPIAGGADPTGSFLDNAVAATGKGISSAARALNVDAPLRAIGVPIGTKEDADRYDKPLMDTAGGKLGNAVGTALPAVPAAMATPATLGGAAVMGGLTGFGLTEGGLADRAEGAAWGAGGGAAGQGLASLVGKAVPWLQNRNALQAVAEQQRAANVGAAQGAGYVLPPNEIKRDLTNAVTNAWSGQIKTKQAAAFKNQENTNRLAARALGLPEDQPLTADAIKSVRKQAGQAYENVRGSGVVAADAQFGQEVAGLAAKYRTTVPSFPGLGKTNMHGGQIDEIADLVGALKANQFDASEAVDAIRILRENADKAYYAGDKTLGKATKEAAEALESLVGRHLQSSGNPQLLAEFQQSRKLIAKTYDVERALLGETGNVSAAKLGAKATKTPGRFSGELKQIADSHNAFPGALQTLKEAPSNYSAVDGGMAAISTLAGAPWIAAYNAARPAVRSAILSGPGQRFAGMDVLPRPTNALRALLEQANRPAMLRSAPFAGTALTYGPRE